MTGSIEDFVHSKRASLLFRIGGHYFLALVFCFLPEVGEQRFILAAILTFFVAPIAIWLGSRNGVGDNGWGEPLFDLITVVILVHLVPESWHAALLIGVICAQAPSISIQVNSYKYYIVNYIILLVAMSAAAIIHDVDGWHVPIIVLSVIFPGLFLYTHAQKRKSDEFRIKAQAHDSLKLVTGGIAHDFSNILQIALGFSELALKRLDQSHAAYHRVEETVIAVNRASLLTNQLLSFSGRQVTHKIQLDLGDEINTIAGLLRSIVTPGIEISVVCNDNLPFIEGDPSQIQQVFLNIILNAAEACVSPSVVSVTLTAPGEDLVQVLIQDSGSGIENENIDKIFNPFYTSKPKGHGLGLAVVKQIVSEHSGTISLLSTVGVGTLVSVMLPSKESSSTELE